MNINFTTDKVDTKLYEKSILSYVYDHYFFTDYYKIQIQNECVKLGISVMVTSDAYEAMEYLDQGQKVFFYSSHKSFIPDTTYSDE